MKNEKTLFVGGPLDGKKEYIADFRTQKYFIQKIRKFRGVSDYFKYGCNVLTEPVDVKTVYYYPRKLRVSDSDGEVKEFMFMVNDPYMSEITLVEKLISGHRSVKK